MSCCSVCVSRSTYDVPKGLVEVGADMERVTLVAAWVEPYVGRGVFQGRSVGRGCGGCCGSKLALTALCMASCGGTAVSWNCPIQLGNRGDGPAKYKSRNFKYMNEEKH